MATETRSAPDGANVPAILGLVAGSLGLLFCWIAVVGVLLSGTGLALSIIGKKQGGGGIGAAGLVLSIVALVLSLSFTACAVACSAAQQQAAREAGLARPATPVTTAAQEPAPAYEPPMVGKVDKLLYDYKGNEVAADAKYKGKIVEISGVVEDIKKDMMDNVYVTVGTGARFELPIAQCFLVKSEVDKAAALSKGDRITIRGRVSGLMMNVLIKDAVIR